MKFSLMRRGLKKKSSGSKPKCFTFVADFISTPKKRKKRKKEE